jgi:hypothetical protein
MHRQDFITHLSYTTGVDLSRDMLSQMFLEVVYLGVLVSWWLIFSTT